MELAMFLIDTRRACARLQAALMIVPCLSIAMASNHLPAGEIDEFRELIDLSANTPEVSFDVPESLYVRDVTGDEFARNHPDKRLFEVKVPVSLLLFQGDADRIRDVVIEIDGAADNLRVHDYSPRTHLQSDFTEPIEQRRSIGSDRSLAASLGGKLGTDITLTPTINAGKSESESLIETTTKAPPKKAIIVSGTTQSHRGVFFKLRQSSQATLEGEQTFSVTFAAPEDWLGGTIEVRCVARGQQKWLLVERRKVWNETARPLKLKLVSHSVESLRE